MPFRACNRAQREAEGLESNPRLWLWERRRMTTIGGSPMPAARQKDEAMGLRRPCYQGERPKKATVREAR